MPWGDRLIIRRILARVSLVAVLALLGAAATARADGDPGSDVLVYQSLYLAADANVPVSQQVALGGLLDAAQKAGFPIRVAIVSSPADLGAITELWNQPSRYARFLGLELSLAYSGRLLVVMPNGFGFHWPGHSAAPAEAVLRGVPVRPGGTGLAKAAENAVRRLAGTAGVSLPAASALARRSQSVAGAAPAPAAGGSGFPVVIVVAVLVALAVLGGLVLLARRVHVRIPVPARGGRLPISFTAGLLALATLGLAAWASLRQASSSSPAALASNPALDPGTVIDRPAPDFTLSDQLGLPVSLHSFRGRVVILAFNDSECTTICPLTTTAMLDAKAMLGAAGSRVQLLGVDANPKANSIEDVLSYSQVHRMLDAWQFLTGPLPALERVWRSYSIGWQVSQRTVDHTPAVFVIDGRGRIDKLYITQPSYAAVGQFAQILASEVSRLLPDHPAIDSHLSYQPIAGTSPATRVSLPAADGGSVSVGPAGRPRLYLFFATWDQAITGLGPQLRELNGYQRAAAGSGLPALTAIDEASVEPAGALRRFLGGLGERLFYPVGLDVSGRMADGYEVQGQPWFVLVSPTGSILWYWQVASAGWPSAKTLARQVRDALTRGSRAPSTVAEAQRRLAGSPARLAELHAQASQLLSPPGGLTARLHALRGYPVVVNIWASWCGACQAEFPLFASASVSFGRRVAFLGADTSDSAGDAQAFLRSHPVSYPSYPSTPNDLRDLAIVAGYPTTVFLNAAGRVVNVHTGQYDSQGALNDDIAAYALGH